MLFNIKCVKEMLVVMNQFQIVLDLTTEYFF